MRAIAWRPNSMTDRVVRSPLQLASLRPALAPLVVAGLAAGVTALAAAAQYVVLPRPFVAPFLFFFMAVAAAGWLHGRAAGLFTVLLSAAAAHWLFLPPFGAVKLSGQPLGATLLFVVAAAPIALLCGALRERLVAAHAAAAQLTAQAALLERTAASARETEGQFRMLADSMPQLVWTASPDGAVEYYNERSALYAGLERGADGGWSWGAVVHADDRDRTIAAWTKAVATAQVYEVEHRVQMADGTYRWHLSRGVPMRNPQGQLVRWYGTATDVHEQRRAAEALAESDRRKSEFLGVLSHELRNPLAPIRNSLYVATHSPPASDQHRRALVVIARQVSQLQRLVDDLLDVTRITRGKIHLERRRVDLVQIAHQVVEDHLELFRRRGLELAFSAEADAEPLLVLADEARLAQVIGNLLQNAAKFSTSGARTTVRVGAADARLAALSVEDAGRGIPPELLGRLFEPFVQAEQSLDRSMGGLGLGLALVKGLIELHGGTVEARSEGPGMGARFTITIPRERRRPPQRAAVPEPPPAAAPRRILVVEDNTDAAETLAEALELEGHAVEVAFTGFEGLEKARRLRPDVVICDLGLPGMDGFDLARALRADPALAGIRLIALSGYALADDVERARVAGFDRHFPKPPDLDELQRSLGPPP